MIDSIQLHQLICPGCGHSGLIRHACYERKVKIPYGHFKLLVLRIKCPHCGRTHAILPDLIVPYSSIPLKDTIEIILSDTSEKIRTLFFNNPVVDFSDIRRIQNNYRKHWKERLISFGIRIGPDISRRCIEKFKRQFMQIPCTLCGFFG